MAMARLTAGELKTMFPLGCVVRVKQDRLDNWNKALSTKLRERLGEVVVHQFPGGDPVVAFHAVGRRSLVRMPFSSPEHYLDVLTDEKEIQDWRASVTKTEDLRQLKISKKRIR
jgi:hypothetical protein